MGMVKEWMISQQCCEYFFVDGNVCGGCFVNKSIKKYIKRKAIARKCDFCGKFSKELIAASFDEVMQIVNDGIRIDWQDPVHEIAYNSGEGGYQAETIGTYELLSVNYEISNREIIFEKY